MTTRPELLVRGGMVCTPAGLRPLDLAITDGRIVALTPRGQIEGADRVIGADGLTVLPGAIDAHVHFDEPGRPGWEGWRTGSAAAAAGGVTTVVDMPIDSDPPTTTARLLDEKRQVATGTSLVDFALWGGIVDADTRRLGALLRSGAVGYKAFLCDSGWSESPPVDRSTLEAACRFAASVDTVVAVHCELESRFTTSGPPEVRRPVESEVDAVRAVVDIAGRTGAAIHVVHVSAAEAVDVTAGVATVSVETCPHYLTLSAEDVAAIGPAAHCAPPIRDHANRDRLWDLVGERRIDTIASDHSPCPAAAKATGSPFLGIDGVETTLSLLISEGRCGLERISELRTEAARLLGLRRKGALAAGYDADLALVDPGATWTPGPDTLHSRQQASPFAGRVLHGVVDTTILRGDVVYAHGAVVGEPSGRFCRPALPRGRPPHR